MLLRPAAVALCEMLPQARRVARRHPGLRLRLGEFARRRRASVGGVGAEEERDPAERRVRRGRRAPALLLRPRQALRLESTRGGGHDT